ncbi:Conserved_hypothetical protein [Hexamita inflata]|uniref:Uncharacterized protein n=1 Tax=Hexamita inflata TaxID=28002 RepID=A0AA86PTF6_9EUKA|nr:Conserved hypothetical protein [Hexamita inflata]
MQPNHVIESKEELLNHFGSSQKLEICDLIQMKNLLALNVAADVWEDASNRNLLSFSKEFVQQTKELTLNITQIEHIYLISFLVNLTELDLFDNNISDIFSISKLKNLKKINLGSNVIEDISALQSLSNITFLHLQYNKITSYALALPSLVELSLSNIQLKDKSGLQHSPKLQKLYLSETETTDLQTIPPQLFGLKSLDLSWNNFTEISYLSNFVGLQCISLSNNIQLQNIGPLKFCNQITELRIHATSVADIWPLQFLNNLKILNMNNTKIVDLRPLQFLYKLEDIYAFDACVIDVSPLSKLTQLDFLDFCNNKITNGDILKHHPNNSEYQLSKQEVPTTEELKFYNKILNVHNSHKQIRKIFNENRIHKLRATLASKNNYVSTMLNNQIMMMSKELNLFAHFLQNSNDTRRK